MAYQDIKNTHTHTQTTPAASWVVVHGLSLTSPAVNVWVEVDGVVTAMVPKNIHIDDVNTVTITFSTAHAGSAVIQ
jgi:hypothetical protein